MSHQPPPHQVGQEVAEGGSCCRAEADRQEGHREREEKARDDGEKYGAWYGESLEEDVNTEEPSQYLQHISFSIEKYYFETFHGIFFLNLNLKITPDPT